MLYKQTNSYFLDDIPKISEAFPKIVRRPLKRFRAFSEKFRRYPEDILVRTDDVSIIQQQI